MEKKTTGLLEGKLQHLKFCINFDFTQINVKTWD